MERQIVRFPHNTSGVWWHDDPELATLFAKSGDYDLLAYIWKQWRQQTGVSMRPLYMQYVELMNKGLMQNFSLFESKVESKPKIV